MRELEMKLTSVQEVWFVLFGLLKYVCHIIFAFTTVFTFLFLLWRSYAHLNTLLQQMKSASLLKFQQ